MSDGTGNESIEKKLEYLYRGEKSSRGWVIAAMIGKGAFDFVFHLCPFRFNSLSHFAPFYSPISRTCSDHFRSFVTFVEVVGIKKGIFLLNRSPRQRNEILRIILRKRGMRVVYSPCKSHRQDLDTTATSFSGCVGRTILSTT